MNTISNDREVKILLFDEETSPNVSYTWGKYDQNVVGFKKEWEILCFSYKWFKGTTKCISQWNSGGEKNVVKKLWELFNEADLVVAHNANGFDVKRANARFFYYNLPPPKPYKVIDTLSWMRKLTQDNSQKLNDLSQKFGFGKKVDTGGFQLWLDVMQGNKEAQKKMEKYNKQDVELLEKLFIKLSPWISSQIMTGFRCSKPGCGSEDVTQRGYRYTKTRRYKSFKCNKCGGFSQSNFSESTDEILTS